MAKIEVDTVTLPAAWASALVNEDWSGLDAEQTEACKQAMSRVAAAGGWYVVGTDDDAEPRFTNTYRLYDPTSIFICGDVLDYVVHRRVAEDQVASDGSLPGGGHAEEHALPRSTRHG